MTRRALNTLFAGSLAATIAATAPAVAGGSISFSYTPTTAQQAQALQTGFQLYSLFSAVQNGANISQYGTNNAAGIGQYGTGNFGVVHQEGTGHIGTLQQNGNYNTYGIFQFGQNTNANVIQNGNGQTGATFQFGW